MLKIDVHTHIFNSDDIPVMGFIANVRYSKVPLKLGYVFGWPAALLTRRRRTYEHDVQEILDLGKAVPPLDEPCNGTRHR